LKEKRLREVGVRKRGGVRIFKRKYVKSLAREKN